MAGDAKFWTAVCYPENMREDWEQKIDALLEFPYAYCKHDIDRDSKSEHRKDHVHIMFVWTGNTTEKAALKLVRRLSTPGKNCCSGIQPVHNVRRMYDYLIHDTEDCRKAGKELYSATDRIEGNNFDIGMYEQISTEEKSEAAKQICTYIVEKDIHLLSDLFVILTESEDFAEAKYWEAFKQYNAMFERICKSVYLKYQAKKEKT